MTSVSQEEKDSWEDRETQQCIARIKEQKRFDAAKQRAEWKKLQNYWRKTKRR